MYFTSPPATLADNWRQANPDLLAKGSSSNKKSGGGELRGADIWLKAEIDGMGMGWGFGFALSGGTKERDGEREERGCEMIIGICGLATS